MDALQINTLATWAPLLFAVALPYLCLTLTGKQNGIGRIVASAGCIFFGLRYLAWRWFDSMPEGQEPWQQVWAWTFLLFETLTILSSTLVFFFMSRTRDRSREVDARAGSQLLQAPVDVFIATYNEEREILERTIVGALAIEHPDLRVWVLDDGARPWVRDLATELGAEYLFRVKGKQAKAGNVNNGLRHALTTGRKPHFVLLLDADFVANRRILQRTLPLFEERDVGIVQTPQHFFNPDPIQSNLLSATAWPDEQRFFFSHLLASKDAWGTAFCCGTSAVFRVEALEASGGLATETVTEDMLTSFRMLEQGYRTVFLNEQLSMGLAPEGLKEYISQRSRWCLGAIQQVYTRWSFFGRARIGLRNRISSFDGVLHWTVNYAFKLMMISAPMVYWWTGTAVLRSTPAEIIYYLGPYMFGSMLFMACLARNTVFPILTDVTQLLSSIAIARTVAVGFCKPWGHPFVVTAKGVTTSGVTVQWSLLMPSLILAVGTALGMLINLSPYSPLNGGDDYAVNMFWSVFNIAVLAIAIVICVELPKRRSDERFSALEAASVRVGTREDALPCTVLDISLSGARLRRPAGWADAPKAGSLQLYDVATAIPFRVTRVTDDELGVEFDRAVTIRRALIRKLFTGDYHNEVERIRPMRTMASAARLIFR